MLICAAMMDRGKRVLKAIDPRVEPALKVLFRDGLPEMAHLELSTIAVCGVPRPDVTRIELAEDGSLTLGIERSALKIHNVDPDEWNPSVVVATLAGGEDLVLDQGDVHVSGRHFSPRGPGPSLTTARIHGWSWHVDARHDIPVLWAARVRFSAPVLPAPAVVPQRQSAVSRR